MSNRAVSRAVQPKLSPLPRIRNILAVGSGKGGVGKSTTAVNLALALAADGARVGVLDADVYGPSIPAMLGLSGRPDSPDGKSIEPMWAHGVEAMSIGLLVEQDTPMIWRGPMTTQALQQLLNETAWQDLDYLVIDLPPGTGDVQLTLIQKTPLDGAVIVSTPQEVALADARRAHTLFAKVGVPTLGLIENMSGEVFGTGGAEAEAARLNAPYLGDLPLDGAIRRAGDAGRPLVAADPQHPASGRFHQIAAQVAAALGL